MDNFLKNASQGKDKERNETSNTNQPNKPNYCPWIIGISIVIGSLIIGLSLYFALGKKKEK